MHRGVQWPKPTLVWPEGKLICCTFRVAYEAFRKSGRFKRSNKVDVNVTSLSHANYGGAVGVWRLILPPFRPNFPAAEPSFPLSSAKQPSSA